MYGLIFATHQLNLPFTLVKSFVLSETASWIREGWEYIDQIKDDEVCQSVSLIKQPLPVTLHYCERYAAQNFAHGLRFVAINAHPLSLHSALRPAIARYMLGRVRSDCLSIEVVPNQSFPALTSCASSSSRSIE
jgi:hypothetical protein